MLILQPFLNICYKLFGICFNTVLKNCRGILWSALLKQLYMHCSMSVGSSTPTPTAKSCNYDTKAKRFSFFFLEVIGMRHKRFKCAVQFFPKKGIKSSTLFFSDGLSCMEQTQCAAAATPTAARLHPQVSLCFPQFPKSNISLPLDNKARYILYCQQSPWKDQN